MKNKRWSGAVLLALAVAGLASCSASTGSSDAAAVLLALPVLAGGKIPGEQLSQLATRLGSDVPFFLYGGAAVGMGRFGAYPSSG